MFKKHLNLLNIKIMTNVATDYKEFVLSKSAVESLTKLHDYVHNIDSKYHLYTT